jgi:predicted metal-dependent phosphoesterase TrpH
MRLDLHVHSIYSADSFLRPEMIIKIARKCHLDGIAVTDHNTLKGGLRTRSIAPKDFLVIPGTEIKTEKGEIIGLFIEEEISSRIFDEVVKEIKEQGGITILPHPYRNSCQNPEELVQLVDAVEIMNARTSPLLNKNAFRLAEKYSKAKTGGSDAHHWFEIGQVYTNISGNEISDKSDIWKNTVEIVGSELPLYKRKLSTGIGKIIQYSRCIRRMPDE